MSRTRSPTVTILLHRTPNRHHQAEDEQSSKSWKGGSTCDCQREHGQRTKIIRCCLPMNVPRERV